MITRYSDLSILNTPFYKKILILEDQVFGKNLSDIYEVNRNLNFLVFTRHGMFLGYIAYMINEGNNIEIFNLATNINSQNKGIMTRLLSTLMVDDIYLEVRETNTQAVNLYNKLGFEVYDKVDNYYGNAAALKMMYNKGSIKKAYAKINLVLNVLAKREDGFHEVDFIMSSVDLYDEIIFRRSDVDKVICQGVAMEDNLAYKALKLLKEEYNIDECFEITINKQIPMAAGMAGGSSDAACVINTINEVCNLKIKRTKRMEFGAHLGSDIPFCILSRPARAQGRGEIITKLKFDASDYHVVVVNPGVELKTADVYNNLVIEEPNDKVENFDVDNLSASIHNQMQNTSISLCPEIQTIIDEFATKFDTKAIVSGSGPSVFCVTKDETLINEMYDYFKAKYDYTYKTKILK